MLYARKEKYAKPRTPADVLKMALQREKASFKFYQQIARKEINPSIKRVFLKMKEQELCHVKYIKNLLGR